VAKNREPYLENYYLKNRRSIDKGKNGTDSPNAWVIPAAQRRKADAADMVNELRRQGVEVHTADAGFQVGKLAVAAGDYVVRGDQPYRTLVDMYTSVQQYAPTNPRPYDDTGWTMQYLRDVNLTAVHDKSILAQPMTLLKADAKAAGGVEGTGGVLVVEHTSDNNLMKFRMMNPGVQALAAEEDFELDGRKFRAGAMILPNADRARLEPQLKDLGLSAWAVAAAPQVKTHELTMPRIGYAHSWSRTQDEGWVRAAFDYYGVPYTYFADVKLKEGGLRAKYDVIVFPHIGGTSQSMINGVPATGTTPVPYKKTAETPSFGAVDSSDDIRGGMGMEGMAELTKFVEEGGLLITEGSTAALLAEYDLAAGVTVEHPANFFARGSILRGVFADKASPIAYGYDGKDLPVYFNQDPVLHVEAAPAGGFGGFGGGGRGAIAGPVNGGEGQNVFPNVTTMNVSPLEGTASEGEARAAGGRSGRGARGGRGAAAGEGGRGGRGAVPSEGRPRVILEFPANANDMLLSGTIAGGSAISGRAALLDVPLGKGHIVMFALRPFWRWQTQGTFMLAFNAILNWDHLDAGKPSAATPATNATPAGQ
jgi:hypothetical protein